MATTPTTIHPDAPTRAPTSVGTIQASRRAIGESAPSRRWLSPATRGLERTLVPAIDAHARGEVLDVGCGSMPYRDVVRRAGGRHHGLDVERRHPDVEYVAPATDMDVAGTAAFDTVVCTEVLEHVDRPDLAVAEFRRVLRRGGTAIVSVPFLGRLHEEPHDYTRFTEHGLRALMHRNGFDIVSLERTGTVVSFLGHQVSSAVVLPLWRVPVLGRLAFACNAALVVAPLSVLDRIATPLLRKLPLGYVCVARAR